MTIQLLRWRLGSGQGPGTDDGVRVAVRCSGPSVEPAVEVQRLVSSWEAQCARDGTDPAGDLERAPWESSFMRWVYTFSGEMVPTAMVDYVGGEVSVMGGVSRSRPMPPRVGPEQ